MNTGVLSTSPRLRLRCYLIINMNHGRSQLTKVAMSSYHCAKLFL